MTSSSHTVVLIVNASEDAIEAVTGTLRAEGLNCIAARTPDIRRGEVDLSALLAQHDPCAVIWDVALPYYGNWHYLQALRRAGVFGALPVVVTTPNKSALERIIGEETHAVELVGEADDLQRVLARVCTRHPTA
jgi:DNA-binding response OmpR family regulator